MIVPGERADVATARLLRAQLDAIEANLPGALTGEDPECLHDLRVAVRRSRALQRELKSVFPRAPLERFRGEFRHLQAITGPTRDLDVHLADADDLAQGELLERLRARLQDRRAAARAEMVEALRSPRVAALLDEWAAFLAGGERLEEVPPVGKVAARRLRRVHRRMLDDGGAIDAGSPPEALHDLRKRGKELRYLLEFFGSDTTKPLVKSLKALQNTLGRFQDREVQAELVRELLGEEAAPLVDRLQAQQAQARDEFAARFTAFAAVPASF